MTGRWRPVFLTGLLLLGGTLGVALYFKGTQPPLPPTLAPAFQTLGTPVKTLDRLVGKVLPVDALDERELGEVIRTHYETGINVYDADYLYVNELLDDLARRATKPFAYQAYLLDYPGPNAMALPGGVILVTSGLLDTLASEAELVSVLSHELGHIEQGHCFDAVKFALTADKIGAAPLGKLADMAVNLLVRHSFSKTQEAEADEYSYTLLVNSEYDPSATSDAFASLLAYLEDRGASPPASDLNPIRDYFMSHPPLELRVARYREEARLWWSLHDGERYIGKANLRERRSLYVDPRSTEWTSGAAPDTNPERMENNAE